METIDKILMLLSEKGITANRFSIDLGLNNSAISEWKKGKSAPSAKKLKMIADYFNVTTDYLLGRTDIKGVPSEEDYKHYKEIFDEFDMRHELNLEGYKQLPKDDRTLVSKTFNGMIDQLEKKKKD